MATYGLHYFYRFTNRQNDTFRVEILEQSYVGVSTELTGSGAPFIFQAQSGDNNIYSPIKPTTATIQFWNADNGYSVSLSDFYSDTDNFFRVDFYEEGYNTLLWTGFVQIDNSAEELQDIAHVIELQANDNLGLLQNITFDVALEAISLSDYSFYKLTDIISAALQQTSLQLNTEAYLNIFENTTDDRSIVDTNDFLQQTVIHTNYFLNSDGTFKDCYTVLEALCNDFDIELFQSYGKWIMIREGEFRLFADNAVPGTEYDYQFNILNAVTFQPIQTIGRNAIPNTYPFEPIHANQQQRILRPFKIAKRTLTYEQPQWIDDQTFINLGNLFEGPAAVPYPGLTYANVEYIGWEVPNDWYIETAFIACLVTAYDTTLGNTEIDRFLDILTLSSSYKWLQFNPIPVVAKSKLSWSFDFFAFWVNHFGPIAPIPNTGDFDCACRIQLLTASGTIYNLTQSTSGGIKFLTWGVPVASSTWDAFIGLTITGQYNGTDVPDGTRTAEGGTNSWDLASFSDQSDIPVFPEDGLLLIGMAGNNGPGETFYDCGIRNINLSIENNLGAISSMVAQVHAQQQAETIKNNSEIDLAFDDTIVNTIKGTLLTDALTSYGIWVGDTYVTKTSLWHRAALSEELKVSQINSFDTLFIQRIARAIVEGDFFGLHYERPIITGNGTIEIDAPQIEISGRANADGIFPGMYIAFDIYIYKIVSVSYDSGTSTVIIVTDPVPVGSAFPDVDYTIYWPQQYISMINILQIAFLSGMNFNIGIASVDFMSCIWSATLYNFYDDGEVDGDLTAAYSFKYLFQSK